jgi:hypothetical protein
MKTRRISTTVICLAVTIFLLTTLAVVHSQRTQQQTRPIEAKQIAVLQLAQKPKVPISLVPDVPKPPGDVNSSMKARRDYAWEIVQLVWGPVTVEGDKVPRWMTWYEQEEIEEMYSEMLFQRPRPRTHAEIVAAADAVMAKHSVKELQASLTSARLGKVLRQFTFPALQQISHHVANGTIYYSPSYVKHLLENADNVERCDLSPASAGPPPRCAPIVNAIKGLESDRASFQKDLQKAAPGEKSALINQIKEINAQIQQKQRDLDECSKPRADPSPGNVWAKCMDSEMPRDAIMIKANWTRESKYFGQPLMGGATGGNEDSITTALETGKFAFSSYLAYGMLVVTDETGKKWMLTGMHIASKAVRTWLWTSLIWGTYNFQHGEWSADEPNTPFQQLDFPFDYGLCTVSDFEEKDPTPWKAYADGDIDNGKQPLADALKAVAKEMKGNQWCANPYIETDTARTNCIGCHQGSTESFLTTVKQERSTNISDFSFSFATNRANFLKVRAAHP